MRNLGFILLLGGILGFFYCASQLSTLTPLGPESALGDYLRYAAGRWELGKYLAAGAAAVGALLALFPRGR
jgi:hypothetical protein